MKVLAVISLLVLLVAGAQGYTTERQYQREFSRFVKNFSKRKRTAPHAFQAPLPPCASLDPPNSTFAECHVVYALTRLLLRCVVLWYGRLYHG